MGLGIVLLTLTSLFVTTCSVCMDKETRLVFAILAPNSLYRYDLRGYMDEEQECCNGTLAFATNMTKIPCANMRCCDRTETVAVVPVNHALGFGFRCMPRTKIFTRCAHHGQTVVSTNETSVTYEARICCEGNTFDVIINKNDVALAIKCVIRT